MQPLFFPPNSNDDFASTTWIVTTRGAPSSTPTAASRKSWTRVEIATPVGIRVRDALPTKPEAPWTSTRVGKSAGSQRRAIGPGVVPRNPAASSARRGVSWKRNGR